MCGHKDCLGHEICCCNEGDSGCINFCKLVEEKFTSTNSAMVPCPHLWIGTDGVHHTIINQCNHPLVKDWAQHQ